MLCQHRLHLGLEAGADVHQLGPVAHQLSQLSELGRRDPGLGELAQTHAVDELATVPVVVLHPPPLPGLAQTGGVHEMHGGAELLEHVDGPVPAVGGLDGHLGVGPGVGEGLGQAHGTVVDVLDAHFVAEMVITNDQRSVQMQVDRDVLSFHRSSPCSRSVWSCNLECFARTVPSGRGPLRPGRHARYRPRRGADHRLCALRRPRRNHGMPLPDAYVPRHDQRPRLAAPRPAAQIRHVFLLLPAALAGPPARPAMLTQAHPLSHVGHAVGYRLPANEQAGRCPVWHGRGDRSGPRAFRLRVWDRCGWARHRGPTGR